MRRIAAVSIVAALVLALIPVAPARAILPGDTTFTVFTQIHGRGYDGTVSLTTKLDKSAGWLEIDIKGMRPFAMATVRARAGSCAHEGFGVVKVQWISRFRGGHWTMKVPLTKRMIRRWNDALASGGVNFTFQQAGKYLCGNGLAV